MLAPQMSTPCALEPAHVTLHGGGGGSGGEPSLLIT